MDREQLIALVEAIYSLQGTEDEINALMNKFLTNVPDPAALNYFSDKAYEHLSPAEVVDKALSYKPFYL